MYVTHCLMVIQSCVKYGITMSEDQKAVPQTQSHVKTLQIGTLRSKVNVMGSGIYSTHRLTVMDPCIN